MKTLKTLSVLVFAAGIFFTSCKKTDSTPTTTTPTDNNPSINFIGGNGWTSSDAVVYSGQTIKFGFDASANSNTSAKLDTSYLIVSMGSTTYTTIPKAVNGTTGAATASDSVVNFQVSQFPVSGVYTITYKIHDKNGNTNSTSINLTVRTLTNVAGSPVTLGGSTSSTGSYANLETGAVYLQAAAIASPGSVELVYNNGQLYSPTDNAETNSTIKAGGKATYLQLAPGSYSAYSLEGVSIGTVTNVSSVTAGQTYFFSTNGKKGALYITGISGTGTASTITMQVQTIQ